MLRKITKRRSKVYIGEKDLEVVMEMGRREVRGIKRKIGREIANVIEIGSKTKIMLVVKIRIIWMMDISLHRKICKETKINQIKIVIEAEIETETETETEEDEVEWVEITKESHCMEIVKLTNNGENRKKHNLLKNSNKADRHLS